MVTGQGNGLSKNSPHPWHIVLCRHHLLAATVTRLAKLPCVEEVYAPCRNITAIVRGRAVTRQSFFLGGLVLARWDGDDPHAWHDVRDTIGALAIVGGEHPVTVADPNVEEFHAVVAEINGGTLPHVKPPCAIGDVVRFTFGPFQITGPMPVGWRFWSSRRSASSHVSSKRCYDASAIYLCG
jgi:hypothetical protein